MRTDRKTGIASVCLFLAAVLCGEARGESRPEVFLTAIPSYKGNVILGRPTDRSVTLSILLRDSTKVRIAYGRQEKGLNLKTDAFELQAGQPREIVLDSLEGNAAYAYRLVNADTGKLILPENGNGSFQTCRTARSSFTFTVQADSHLDGNCLPELYKTTLTNALADKPDFLIDLGDTFMTGKHESRETAALQYAAQRYYFGLIGYAAPVFLVLGNHDGEETARHATADSDGLAAWSCLQRKRFFPNPVPDGFYSGNAEAHPNAGLLQNYYGFTWGDALFVVLDPYWTSQPTRGGKEPWNMTIGKAQYDWLARTLRASKAQYKFVFIHQLVGGIDRSGRGGIEAAPLYEWGDRDKDGRNTFAANRQGWEKPIHSLLVETGVTMVFHGHDHFFARQELDGVIYQLVPQPSQRNSRNHHAQEYGYEKGVFLPSSGHIRMCVSSERLSIDYIRAFLPDGEKDGHVNGEIASTYFVKPR